MVLFFPFIPRQYLTTVIPYEKKNGPPSVEDLQILTKSKQRQILFLGFIFVYFVSVGGHLALIKWEGALVGRCLAASQVWLGTERLGLCHQIVNSRE